MLFDHRKLLRKDGVVEWRPKGFLFVCYESRQLGFCGRKYGLTYKIRKPCEEGEEKDQNFGFLGWQNIWNNYLPKLQRYLSI